MPRSAWFAVSAAALLAVAGCAEKPVEHTVKKVPAESAESAAGKSAAEGKPGTQSKAKEEFQKELSASLDKLDTEIRELKAKADGLQADAKAKLDKAVAELDAKQEAARAKLDEVSRSSAQAWEHLKQGTEAAWEDLEQAVKKAAKEF